MKTKKTQIAPTKHDAKGQVWIHDESGYEITLSSATKATVMYNLGGRLMRTSTLLRDYTLKAKKQH